jgi:hypothetical protein
VRFAIVSIVVAVGVLGASCDSNGTNTGSTSAPLSLDQVEDQLNEDVVASLLGTWTIRYRAIRCDRAQLEPCHTGTEFEFTWYKDGRERQRFDLTGASLDGQPFFPNLSDDAQVIIPRNDRTYTTLCASSFAPDLVDAGLQPGEGACCEGYSLACGDAGDIAANIVYGELGFLLEYPEGDLTGSTAFSEAELVRYEEREIAGVDARCYIAKFEGADSREVGTVELCYGKDGAELFRDAFTPFAHVRLEALEVRKGIADSELEPPYPVIPNE